MMSNVDDSLLEEMIAHFHYPADSIGEHAAKLSLFCRYFIDVNLSLSAYQMNRYRVFIGRLDAEKRTSAVMQNIRRKDLHSQLQEHPFFSTMSLLPDASEQYAESQRSELLYILLAHLCSARGFNDYAACLQFYNAFLKVDSSECCRVDELKARGITAQFALDSTLSELRRDLRQVALKNDNKTLDKVARYFQPPQQRRIDLAALCKNSIIDTTNKHTFAEVRMDEADIALMQTTNQAGEEVGRFTQVTPHLERTQSQRKRSYQTQQSAISNALRKHELALPFSFSSATVGELRTALEYISQSFICGELEDVNLREASILLRLMLKMLTLSDVDTFYLQNVSAGSSSKKHADTREMKVLRYDLDGARKHVFAQLILPAKLIDTSPPADDYLYEESCKNLKVKLPNPLGSLLNIVLRNKSNSPERNDAELSNVLFVDEKSYRGFINHVLNETGLKKRGVTRRAFETTFFQFAREQAPETFLNFLKNQSTVQSHYINVTNEELEVTLLSAWDNFVDNVGIRIDSKDTHENKSDSGLSDFADNERQGSDRSIKDDALTLLYEQLINTLSQQIDDRATVDAFNNVALYCYMRIATTVALRPVSKPFPARHHFDKTSGLLSVRDKRVHHKDERRLIVLNDVLCQLLCATSTLCDTLSARLAIERPTALVMLLSVDKSGTCRWEHLSKTRVDAQIKTLIDDELSAQAFRHVAANAFLNSSLDDFSQTSLNGFMNHSRVGAGLLSNYSLFDIRHIAAQQRARMQPAGEQIAANDACVLDMINWLGSAL
ncbi:hypothetical protein DFO83_106127 [Idiomarina loihiensis]|uniref:hypothetical protein n=1 Tax=Idiomarina TaxID=135575 RepID=UPI000D711792|nr:hypothetical protein [Idiomarina]PWW36984.1 hypothetical protein DFO83_106127 [Idiomarina loihiensis]TDP46792.1 hypothetical protein DET58_106128 [Idiomarina loihiensis]TDS23063.1 hypothetical protein DET62_106128 [Idiomarina sp. H2]